MGSSGVDRVFSAGAAAQVGGGTGTVGGEMTICGAGRSASMLGVLSASFGGRRAVSDFEA